MGPVNSRQRSDGTRHAARLSCVAVSFCGHSLNQATWGTIAMSLIPIMNKMNAAPVTADLELKGVSELRIRVRCVLYNVQEPVRGFPH
jgi:hypothetical protein